MTTQSFTALVSGGLKEYENNLLPCTLLRDFLFLLPHHISSPLLHLQNPAPLKHSPLNCIFPLVLLVCKMGINGDRDPSYFVQGTQISEGKLKELI